MGCLYAVFSIVVLILQVQGFLAGIHEFLGVGTFLGLLIGLVFMAMRMGGLPIAALTFYGATAVWGWPWWQAGLIAVPSLIHAAIAFAVSPTVMYREAGAKISGWRAK